MEYRRGRIAQDYRRWGGKSYKEARANVETIIQEWIETAKELGRAIPPRAATRQPRRRFLGSALILCCCNAVTTNSVSLLATAHQLSFEFDIREWYTVVA
jgi:hypothetical protein